MLEIERQLAKRIRELREQRDWTQEMLAEVSGLTQGAVQKLENGQRWPTPDTLSAIAEALGIPVQFLFISPRTLGPLYLDVALGTVKSEVTKVLESLEDAFFEARSAARRYGGAEKEALKDSHEIMQHIMAAHHYLIFIDHPSFQDVVTIAKEHEQGYIDKVREELPIASWETLSRLDEHTLEKIKVIIDSSIAAQDRAKKTRTRKKVSNG